MSTNQKSYIYIYILTALCSLTLLSGFLLSSSSVSADTTAENNIAVSVPESCNLTTTSGSGQTYNVSLSNGQYKNDIGKTRLSVFCNTNDTFAIYAVGYSNDTVGNNEMITTTSGVSNIATSTANSGDTSAWAMKIEAVTGTGAGTGVSSNHISYTPTIVSPFNDFAAVPSAWAKVAEVASVTGITNEAAIDASYAVYIAPKQAAANYTGKVRYTVVHPSSVIPDISASLDYGADINLKLKSLANGINITSLTTEDTLITAFVRSSILPDGFTPSSANTISASDSLEPVYVWFDNTDGTIYYYSRASEIWAKNLNYLLQRMKSLTNISGLKYFITDNVTNMRSMLYSSTKTSDLTPITNWKVDNVTDMGDMFYGTQISDLTPITNWKVDNVTDMEGMFATTQISNLTPITNWNVGKVTNMDDMFRSTQISDLTPLTNWNVGNVTSTARMFDSAKISCLAPITNWKVDNVTSMVRMFAATQISDLTPITNWNVENVKSMTGLFKSTQISDLTPLTNWRVDNVTNMRSMFSDTQISDLTPLANWNVGNVTAMQEMFYNIPTLTNTSVISVWNVNKVSLSGCGSIQRPTCFLYMFGGTTPKTNLPIFTSRPGTWDAGGTYIPNS